MFQPRNPASAAAANHPSWATVREVKVQNGGTNDSGEGVLARPAMRWLRALRECDGPLLEALIMKTDFALEALHVAWLGSRRRPYDRRVPWRMLLEAPGLPRLRHLHLGYEVDVAAEPAGFAELIASPLARRLDELVLSSVTEHDVEPCLGVLRAAPRDVKLELRIQRPAWIVRRGKGGAYETTSGGEAPEPNMLT